MAIEFTTVEMFTLIAVVISLVVYVGLKIYEKRLILKNADLVYERNNDYINKLNKISIDEDFKKGFPAINKLAKEFFKEAFGPEYDEDYSALVDSFKKIENSDCEYFCRFMLNLEYASENPENTDISKVKPLLNKILINNKIIPLEDKIGKGKLVKKKRYK